MGNLFPSWIEFPWVGIEFGIKVNITKRVDNIGPTGDYFVVDVKLWAEIPPHSRMRLRNARRLTNEGVKHRCFVLPSLDGDGGQLHGQGA